MCAGRVPGSIERIGIALLKVLIGKINENMLFFGLIRL